MTKSEAALGRSSILLATILVALGTSVPELNAQRAAATPPAAGATVSGTVRDSVSHNVLPQAIVQLVSVLDAKPFTRTENADSIGHFSISGVPDGQYKLGFFHPMLDSLGIEAPLRDVFVDGARSVRTDLAIPSAATLRRALCGKRTASRTSSDSGAVVVGFVRDARTLNATGGATITARWAELTVSTKGIERRTPRQVVNTTPEGWFVFCDVPSEGPVEFLATWHGDSTDRVEMQMPRELFLRRDFYVGPPTATAATGRRLAGTVLSAANGRPVVGAEVKLMDGVEVRTNDRGEWIISDVPAGTRMLETRAVGYYPERRAIDVLDGASPIRLELATLQSVLDTVRIRAAGAADRRASGFAERQHSASGRFITSADIERRAPTAASQLFNSVPGMRLERNQSGSTDILIRGLNADTEPCPANFYIDGAYVGTMTAEDIDGAVSPKSIMGIEIYSGVNVPPMFSAGMAGNVCGSVAIWTK